MTLFECPSSQFTPSKSPISFPTAQFDQRCHFLFLHVIVFARATIFPQQVTQVQFLQFTTFGFRPPNSPMLTLFMSVVSIHTIKFLVLNSTFPISCFKKTIFEASPFQVHPFKSTLSILPVRFRSSTLFSQFTPFKSHLFSDRLAFRTASGEAVQGYAKKSGSDTAVVPESEIAEMWRR